MSAHKSIGVVESAFRWFNELGARPLTLNRADLERHFTSDFALMIDMKMMAVGIDGMMQRMTEMISKTRSWRVVPVPFEVALSEGEMCAAYYQYTCVSPDGSDGKLHVIAIWKVRDGKVAEVRELSRVEQGKIELQPHE